VTAEIQEQEHTKKLRCENLHFDATSQPAAALLFLFWSPAVISQTTPREKWFEKLLKIRWISRWACFFCGAYERANNRAVSSGL
jgi:hypothetical protein